MLLLDSLLRRALVQALKDRAWDTAIDLTRVLQGHASRSAIGIDESLLALLEAANKAILRGQSLEHEARAQ